MEIGDSTMSDLKEARQTSFQDLLCAGIGVTFWFDDGLFCVNYHGVLYGSQQIGLWSDAELLASLGHDDVGDRSPTQIGALELSGLSIHGDLVVHGQALAYCSQIVLRDAQLHGNLELCVNQSIFSLDLRNATVEGDLLLEGLSIDSYHDRPAPAEFDFRGLVVKGAIRILGKEFLEDSSDTGPRFLVDDRELAERLHWAAPNAPIIYDPRPRATNSEQ